MPWSLFTTRASSCAAWSAPRRRPGEWDAVEYVPPDYCGDVGPFPKLVSYEYPSEYRFITTSPIPEKALTLTLGSLLDIAIPSGVSDVPIDP